MENINKEILEQLNQIRVDINIIKQAVDDGELTEWAKQELDEARETPEEEYISHEEVKKKILRN